MRLALHKSKLTSRSDRVRTESGSDRPDVQLLKLSKLIRWFMRHLLQLSLWPVATAPGSDTGDAFVCKADA
jgi:hypothetical protein